MCSELDLLLSDAENAAGAPRTIERSPRNLIGEARAAFDAGARELTGIAATGGKDHPTARLSGPGPRKVRRRVPELAAERGEDFRAGVRIGGWIPFQGQQESHCLACSKMPPACWMPFTSSCSPAQRQVRYTVETGKTRPDTAGAQVIPSTKSGFFCAPHARRLTPRQAETTPRSLHGR